MRKKYICKMAFFCILTFQGFLNAYSLNVSDSLVISLVGIWPYPTGSNVKGDYVDVTFEGTGIRWEGVKWPNAGKSVVFLNGDSIDTVDQYAAQADIPFVWEKNGLPYGRHKLCIKVIGEKTPQSSDKFVNFNQGFKVIGAKAIKEKVTIAEFGDCWEIVENIIRRTNDLDSHINITFNGTAIRWVGVKSDDGGIATIKLDGKIIEDFDLYADNNNVQPFIWEAKGLSDGRHLLTISVAENKNAESKDYFINYVSFFNIGEVDYTNNNALRADNDNFYFANNKLYISNSYLSQGVKIVVYTLDGKKVWAETVAAFVDSINMPKIHSPYIVKVFSFSNETLFSTTHLM